MPTTPGSKPPKPKKRKRGAGNLAKRLLSSAKPANSSKRRRKADPHMSTNAYDTTFDDNHIPDPPSEDESESLSDPEHDPRQDMSDHDDDGPPPAKRSKGLIAAAVEAEIAASVEHILPTYEANGEEALLEVEPRAGDRAKVSVAELKSAGVKALEKTGVVHVKDNVRSLGVAVGPNVEEQQQGLNILDPPPSYDASSQRENVERLGNELSVSAGSGNAGLENRAAAVGENIKQHPKHREREGEDRAASGVQSGRKPADRRRTTAEGACE